MKFKILSLFFFQTTINNYHYDTDLYILELLVIFLAPLFVHLFDMYFDLVGSDFGQIFIKHCILEAASIRQGAY